MTIREKALFCQTHIAKVDKKYHQALRHVIQMPEKSGIKTCIFNLVERCYKELEKND